MIFKYFHLIFLWIRREHCNATVTTLPNLQSHSCWQSTPPEQPQVGLFFCDASLLYPFKSKDYIMVKKIITKKSAKKAPCRQAKRSNRQIPSDFVFALALSAMLCCQGEVNSAMLWYKKSAPRPRPQHLKNFLLRVWHRYQEGDISISARARPKRSKKISDAEALRASSLFLKGKQGLTGWRPLSNAKEVRTFHIFLPRRRLI